MPKAERDGNTLDLFSEPPAPPRRKRDRTREAQRKRERYASDPDFREKTRERESGDAYREYRNAWRRANRRKNPEAVRAEAREYRARNLEKLRQYERDHRKRNIEKARSYGRKWQRRNFLECLLRVAAYRAKKKGLPFDLTLDWARRHYTGQCELTGFQFVRSEGQPNAFSPSIDRINQTLGYTTDNCRFILWAINRFKGTESDETMLTIARAMLATADARTNGD